MSRQSCSYAKRKKRFFSLPREMQEYIANREQERDREIRRSQNEAAEARKANAGERVRLEQARLSYEAFLPTPLQSLRAAHGQISPAEVDVNG